MKRKRYSVEQIVGAIKQHELGGPAGEIIRKLGIAEATFYRWRKQYGRLKPEKARELNHLGILESDLERHEYYRKADGCCKTFSRRADRKDYGSFFNGMSEANPSFADVVAEYWRLR